MLAPSFARGQDGNTLTLEATSNPVNPCAFIMHWHNVATAKAWVCINNNASPPVGSWYQYAGSGAVLTGTGLARDTGVSTELSGDATTSGSNVVTVVKINGTQLSSLATGLLKNTTGTGVPSIAAASDIPATSLATGTSASLTAPRAYYVCTGTCTITPPVPAAGYEFCVMNDDNVSTVITLAALGSSAMYEATARTSYGTAGTGTLVSGGAAADKVCIVGRDSTHYLTVAYTGTWTAN